MMDEMGNLGFWGMGVGLVLMVLFWSSVIVVVVVLIKWLINQSTQIKRASAKIPLQILDKRYARGEMNRDE